MSPSVAIKQNALPVIIGILAVWIGTHLGWWWCLLPVGLIYGLAIRTTRRALLLAVLAACGAWALDLLWQSLGADILGAAGVIAGIMGIGTGGGIWVILLTLVVAALLAVCGAWLGSALRQVWPYVATPTMVAASATLRDKVSGTLVGKGKR